MALKKCEAIEKRDTDFKLLYRHNTGHKSDSIKHKSKNLKRSVICWAIANCPSLVFHGAVGSFALAHTELCFVGQETISDTQELSHRSDHVRARSHDFRHFKYQRDIYFERR